MLIIASHCVIPQTFHYAVQTNPSVCFAVMWQLALTF